MGTGALLYFPSLRTGVIEYHMLIRNGHLLAGFLYILLFITSIRRIVAYGRRLHKLAFKRVHIAAVCMAFLAWALSGTVMWRIHQSRRQFLLAAGGAAVSLVAGMLVK
ncbi:hypothetical protein [Effusibacillus dendaii]|uniref:Uncharacterized protein n=1 Tax=Effusibacillus dendaii TaxID=2743772 RepID=A0A7I8DBX9_9BACL|nr:hypothetical protein [Effusibacillus dendaii]BCJ87604.1 hypothetical protein skT53_25890 [Effusibacillus dendaii]